MLHAIVEDRREAIQAGCSGVRVIRDHRPFTPTAGWPSRCQPLPRLEAAVANKSDTRADAAGAIGAEVRTYQMHVDGAWTDAVDGARMTVLDPATEEIMAYVAGGSGEDADRAIVAARQAFDEGPWPRMPPMERANLLRAAAALLRERSEEIALLETRQMGKLLDDARAEMADSPTCIEHAAGLATSQLGEQVDLTMPDAFATVVREPIGVVVCVTPWNFSLQIGAWKFASALAAGNVVILKPASVTPLTSLEMARCVR